MVRSAPILRPPPLRVGPHRRRFAVVLGAVASLGTAAALAGLLHAVRQDRPTLPSLLGLAVSVGVALLAWTLRPRTTGGHAALVEHRRPDGTMRWAHAFPMDRSRALAASGALLAWAAVPAAVLVVALEEGIVFGIVVGGLGTVLLAGIPVLGVWSGSLRRGAVLLTEDGLVLRRGPRSAEIAWDRILGARLVEHRHPQTVVPFLGLRVRDPETLDRESPLLRPHVAAARGLDVDLAVRADPMVVDPAVLAAAIEYYRRRPQDRALLPEDRWPPDPADHAAAAR